MTEYTPTEIKALYAKKRCGFCGKSFAEKNEQVAIVYPTNEITGESDKTKATWYHVTCVQARKDN